MLTLRSAILFRQCFERPIVLNLAMSRKVAFALVLSMIFFHLSFVVKKKLILNQDIAVTQV